MLKDTSITRRQALAAFGSITAGLALAACGTSQTQATDTSSTSDSSSSSDASAATEDVTVRVASLKGPTTIGLVSMMDTTSGVPTEDAPTEPAEGSTGITYSYTISGAADQVLPLVVKAGIVPSEAIAEKAIPKCNIVCTTGEDMRSALSGYLQVLYDADASSVGGTLPGDDFYYEA